MWSFFRVAGFSSAWSPPAVLMHWPSGGAIAARRCYRLLAKPLGGTQLRVGYGERRGEGKSPTSKSGSEEGDGIYCSWAGIAPHHICATSNEPRR